MVPGFWLDASSWGEVTPTLEAAGHRARPITLPGLSSPRADRSEITLSDHVDAVVAEIDATVGPLALVAHSGAAAPVHAAVDARPDRVDRVIYVDCVPLGDGDAVNRELPVIAGEIPLPDWSGFDKADLVDLDDGLRAEFRARAVSEPRGPAYDAVSLTDVRRYDVPVTVIACEFGSALIREWIEAGQSFAAELGRIHHREFVDLPTGHWPQFTRPRELGDAIVAALSR